MDCSKRDWYTGLQRRMLYDNRHGTQEVAMAIIGPAAKRDGTSKALLANVLYQAQTGSTGQLRCTRDGLLYLARQQAANDSKMDALAKSINVANTIVDQKLPDRRVVTVTVVNSAIGSYFTLLGNAVDGIKIGSKNLVTKGSGAEALCG